MYASNLFLQIQKKRGDFNFEIRDFFLRFGLRIKLLAKNGLFFLKSDRVKNRLGLRLLFRHLLNLSKYLNKKEVLKILKMK